LLHPGPTLLPYTTLFRSLKPVASAPQGSRCTMSHMVMLETIVQVDPEILGGTPVFRGTRVPVKNLLDYLVAGDTLDRFLDDFPTDRKSTRLNSSHQIISY